MIPKDIETIKILIGKEYHSREWYDENKDLIGLAKRLGLKNYSKDIEDGLL